MVIKSRREMRLVRGPSVAASLISVSRTSHGTGRNLPYDAKPAVGELLQTPSNMGYELTSLSSSSTSLQRKTWREEMGDGCRVVIDGCARVQSVWEPKEG